MNRALTTWSVGSTAGGLVLVGNVCHIYRVSQVTQPRIMLAEQSLRGMVKKKKRRRIPILV